MTERRTWIDSLSDGSFEVSFDKMLRHQITVYRKRERMSARRFGDLALGDRGFYSHRLRDGSSVALKTADKAMAFMGEPSFGPWFRCEVETFFAITGSKAHWLGHYAVNDPSFVSRLRRDASVSDCPSSPPSSFDAPRERNQNTAMEPADSAKPLKTLAGRSYWGRMLIGRFSLRLLLYPQAYVGTDDAVRRNFRRGKKCSAEVGHG